MRCLFLAFPGFQLLDVTGPAAVFGAACDDVGEPAQISVVAGAGGMVTSNCGLALACSPLPPARAVDGLFVVGGDDAGMRAMVDDARIAQWFRRQARSARFHGSICTGALALAAWGLTRGKRVTTHWRTARDLAARDAGTAVESDAMYICDGSLWTSAGVTAGIDMALALVEQSFGASVARRVARRLVMSVRRAGFQSQYSPMVDAQARSEGRYSDLVAYIASNLHARLDVASLADRVAEAPRTFHRRFRAVMGVTPQAFVSGARLDRARELLADGNTVKQAASACGYSSPEHLAKTFVAAFGVSPANWRQNNRV